MYRLLTAGALLLICCFEAVAQGYGGPTILSRGGNRPGHRGRAPIDFTFYAGTRGIYESGLIRPTLTPEGELPKTDRYGYMFDAGLYGGHDWKRSSIGVDYRADYRASRGYREFDGTNQALALTYQNRVSRRVSLSTDLTAGISNRAFGGYAAPAAITSDRFGVPIDEVYDVRTDFGQADVAVSYQRSARSMFEARASAFVVKRRTATLISSQGYRARGTYLYQLSARTAIGPVYAFNHFNFPRAFGLADIHTAGFGGNRTLTRNWRLTGMAGVNVMQVAAVQQITLSPEIALILGRSTGIEAFDTRKVGVAAEANAQYLLEHGAFQVGFFTGVTPGNGIYLTAQRTSINTGYSYSGIRKLALGVSAAYNHTTSVALRLGAYNSYQAGGGLTYKIIPHLNLAVNADMRSFNAPGVQGRSGYAVSIGLNLSPTALPISIW